MLLPKGDLTPEEVEKLMEQAGNMCYGELFMLLACSIMRLEDAVRSLKPVEKVDTGKSQVGLK